MTKPMILEYNAPAPEYADFVFARQDDKPNAGWEKWSLPIGNSHFGASLFGRTDKDRIQITENSVANPSLRGSHWKDGSGGTRTFGDLIFDFGHKDFSSYKRTLYLDDAVSTVSYTCGGINYNREYFLSYPDNVLAVRLSTSKEKSVSFSLTPLISFCKDYCISEGDGAGRSGEVFSDGEESVMRGVSFYYDIKYEGRVHVVTHGGTLKSENGTITVKNADIADVFFTCGTNYKLESRVFTENDPKKKLEGYPDPDEYVKSTLDLAVSKGYEKVKERHLADYHALFSRVSLDLGGKKTDKTTDTLINEYKNGEKSKYLEELLFQYGRYLLIASSRKGGYPANLQGTWNCYDSSPWGCDYHHNINVQMNYWPACPANLTECFIPYSDYAEAYMPLAKQNADVYIKENYPQKYDGEGKNGWTIGTAATLYYITEPSSHSGPGTGGFTSLLFWDYYDFTRDEKYLREKTYPYLLEMSRFLLKVLEEHDGKLLTGISASPEQCGKDGKYYITKGCAFDQQMIYENFDKTVKAAKILGITDEPLIDEIKEALPRLDPVEIGADGQIKEFREEVHYSDIGEPDHRHVSHLVGLYPGTLINKRKKEWIDGAKVTLNLRSDKSTGWAAAHRLCLWARTGDGNRSYDLLSSILKNNILPNMWDTHPPFQIDGNFGATAGMCEMLLQSTSGYIDVLASLPDEWKNGEFAGLLARGGFEVSCEWINKTPVKINIKSKRGGKCRLRFNGTEHAAVDDKDYSIDNGIIEFQTIAGENITIVSSANNQ